MKQAACPRLFEVEALRDGRLTGAERVSFERHLTICSACAREAAALASLQQALHDSFPGARDELQLRRERTRLLGAFDHALLTPERPWPPGRRRLGLAAAVTVVVALSTAALQLRPGSPARRAEAVDVRAEPGASWSRSVDQERERIVLERGVLHVHVREAHEKLPLLVVLPDGELEDTGTTFSVAVAAGKTLRVTVAEGSVALRLHGRKPVSIGAGATWTAPPAPAPAATAPELAPRTAERSAAPASSAPALPETTERSAATRTAPRAAGAAEPAPPPAVTASAASDFRAAVRALRAGEHRVAAALFLRFTERHPRDSRAEDAAYLRVLALRRAGDDAAMKSAALEYLRRHPSGFRRNEVEDLARRGAPAPPGL